MGKGIFKRENLGKGGGLLDDCKVTFKEVEFTTFNYGGVAEATAFKAVLLDEEDVESEQYWSCGAGWTPSKDGKSLVSSKGKTQVNESSNFGIFLSYLADADFPQDKLEDDDIKVLEGMVAHVIRVDAPKRNLAPKPPRADGKVYKDTILVVNEIISLPGEKKAGKGKAAGGGKVADKTTASIMEILGENPKGMDKKKLASAVFAANKNDPDRSAMVQLTYDDEFLGAGPWDYDGKTVKM